MTRSPRSPCRPSIRTVTPTTPSRRRVRGDGSDKGPAGAGAIAAGLLALLFPYNLERGDARCKRTATRTGQKKNRQTKPQKPTKFRKRENAGKNGTDLDGLFQEGEAIGQREHGQDTQGNCKTSGPPGTAEVSQFPTPEKPSTKHSTKTKTTHTTSPAPTLSVKSS